MEVKKVDNGIFRGGRPVHDDDFTILSTFHNIRTVLNLESGAYETLFSHRNHEFIASVVHGMIPLHLLMSDIFPPTTNEIGSALSILRNPDYKPIYVHCLHGVDRTGVICLAYRCVVQGWDFDAAYQEMLDEGFHWMVYGWWKPWIKKSVEELTCT